MPDEPRKIIGFKINNTDLEPMKNFNKGDSKENTEKDDDSELEGIYYDLNGNAFSVDEINSKVCLNRVHAKNQILTGIGKFILYSAIAASLLQITHDIHKKYTNSKLIQITNIKMR